MERKPCEICGDPNSEADHYIGYNYENAKVVRWLCKFHHTQEHLRIKNLLTPTVI